MRSAAEDPHEAVALTTALAAPEEAFDCWEALISDTFVLRPFDVAALPISGAVVDVPHPRPVSALAPS